MIESPRGSGSSRRARFPGVSAAHPTHRSHDGAYGEIVLSRSVGQKLDVIVAGIDRSVRKGKEDIDTVELHPVHVGLGRPVPTLGYIEAQREIFATLRRRAREAAQAA